MDPVAARLAALYETGPVLVAQYDDFDRLRYANAAFRSAFVLTADETPLWSELMRRNQKAGFGTVIRAPDFEAWLVSTQSRRGKTGFRAFETDLVDGRWLWMTETVQSDGWMLCIASDITSLKASTRDVRQARDFAIRASNTDELTGIANRRFVNARIEDMLRQAEPRNGIHGCVAFLDLDNFKYMNDRFGHQAGDVILRDFAAHINGLLRRRDCVGRIGGEEFVLVLPETPVQQAVLLIERMMGVVRLSRPLKERPDVGYTFSAGVAESGRDISADDICANADSALYTAKFAGRNRVRVYDPAAEAKLG